MKVKSDRQIIKQNLETSVFRSEQVLVEEYPFKRGIYHLEDRFYSNETTKVSSFTAK